MATADELDNEALMAQIEKEFEEAEKKKKEAKRGKKKGGKAGDEAEESQQKPNDEAGKGDSDQKKTETQQQQPAGHKKQDKKQKGKKKEGDEDKEDKQAEKTDGEKPEVTPKPAQEAKESDKKKKKAGEQKPAAVAKAADTKKPEAAETDAASRPESAATEKAEPSGKDKKGAKGKKGPSGALKQIKEALAKTKEIEDELRRQEEEKDRKAEEERQRQLEKERLEKERKERKKQKEKERKEKLKQEGKYLTNKQKEQQKRAIIQLEALGIQVKKLDVNEEPGEVVAEQQKKPKFERKRKDKQETQTEEQAKEESEVKEDVSQQVETVVQEPKVKENWFDESEEETEEQQAQTAQKQQQQRTQSMTSEDISDSEEEESDEEESSEESDVEEEEEGDENLPPHERVKKRLQKRHENAEKHRSTDNLRAPVICVLGHVDTGKTKILDNLRKTRVQEDEAGGITQQIGATNVPLETITERTKMCTYVFKNEIKVPGLLIIDTPGHESFKSLRTRGSSLCDIAILVVDIMHGLEPQTIESINILKNGKTPFLIALNKIDRLFEWKTNPHLDIQEVLKKQQTNTRLEFERRTTEIITQIAEQGLNARLFYENPDPRTYISIVPTSAHSSDGTGNLIALIIEFSQTILAKRISFSNEIQCSVMEVKVIPSLGTTIDVCLVNGRLKVTDKIIVPGQEGPIETQIRGLLLPQPNRELRVKSTYVTHKEVQGARGIKIAARGLEKAMPGLPLFVAYKEDEIDYYKQELDGMLKQALNTIHLSDVGVIVQASTLGSLEALLEFLKTSKVPYSGIGIGPIHKKDVTKASIMLEKDNGQWAVILAFDVKVERDAQELADNLGIRIFTADIIYHLFDKFIGYREELKRKKREEFKDVAVFPCKLKIMPEFIFNTRDPIVVGVKVEAGFLKIGTPLVAICEDTSIERESKEKFVDIGRITSIEYNHKQMEVAKTGNEVCIKIENTTGGAPKLLGRHFSEKDILASKISRESIDAVKEYFREEMTKSDWQLIIDLKKQFNIL